jgi:hypothetical protein
VEVSLLALSARRSRSVRQNADGAAAAGRLDVGQLDHRTLDEDAAASETWRDPFAYADPGGDGWHMLVTARAPGGPRLRDGVLAHARSRDMLAW